MTTSRSSNSTVRSFMAVIICLAALTTSWGPKDPLLLVASAFSTSSSSCAAVVASRNDKVMTSLSAEGGQCDRRPTTSTRRQVLVGVGGVSIAAAGIAAGSSSISANAAEVDYSKVQDLLGGAPAYEGQQVYKPDPNKRPAFLKEPTEEFKQNEEKATSFKREQIKRKKAFNDVMDRLETDPNDESSLVDVLVKMTDAVHYGGGLPLGITKDEVVAKVRRRKGRRPKFWPTPVEIAYQDLIQEIQFQQSPNKEKDEDNPI